MRFQPRVHLHQVDDAVLARLQPGQHVLIDDDTYGRWVGLTPYGTRMVVWRGSTPKGGHRDHFKARRQFLDQMGRATA